MRMICVSNARSVWPRFPRHSRDCANQQYLLFLLFLLLLFAAACSPLNTLRQDQVEITLQLARLGNEAKLLGHCRNKTNITIPNIMVIYETSNATGAPGPTGHFFPLSSPLEPNQIVNVEQTINLADDLNISHWVAVVERPSVRFLKTILIGLLIAGGLMAQVSLLSRESDPFELKRMRIAGIVTGGLLLGIIGHSLLNVLDPQAHVPWSTLAIEIGKGLLLGLSLMIQIYLGPLTVSFVLSSCVYFWFTYGALYAIPVIQTLFEWVFAGSSGWLSIVYVSTVALFALGSVWLDA